jgi:glycerol-3-phosphate dehydrogenase (NAD(P)+)
VEKDGLHERTRVAGVNTFLYWSFRLPLELALKLYWRTSKLGCEQIPSQGPVIIACNHRSFFDPWVIGTMPRRPVYYVAKRELFKYRPVAWILNSLGAFPVERGKGDADTIRTARALLERGEVVMVFAEGTRTRPGPLGTPKRGFARLALEVGAPIVPVAIIGTERVRRRFWLAPDKITVRAGAPTEVEADPDFTPNQARELTEQVWQDVERLWRSIGGEPTLQPQELRASARAV